MCLLYRVAKLLAHLSYALSRGSRCFVVPQRTFETLHMFRTNGSMDLSCFMPALRLSPGHRLDVAANRNVVQRAQYQLNFVGAPPRTNHPLSRELHSEVRRRSACAKPIQRVRGANVLLRYITSLVMVSVQGKGNKTCPTRHYHGIGATAGRRPPSHDSFRLWVHVTMSFIHTCFSFSVHPSYSPS